MSPPGKQDVLGKKIGGGVSCGNRVGQPGNSPRFARMRTGRRASGAGTWGTQCGILLRLKIGSRSDRAIVPMMTPITAIMIGSTMLVTAFTLVSTSWS